MLLIMSALHVVLGTVYRKDDGATAVEYGLMVSLIAVAIITAVTLIGFNLNAIFGAVAAAL